jgi:hypothetical protein
VIRPPGADRDVRPDRPRATDKWLTASVVADARAVIAAVFDEAERRYPPRQREWVMLVDGRRPTSPSLPESARGLSLIFKAVAAYLVQVEQRLQVGRFRGHTGTSAVAADSPRRVRFFLSQSGALRAPRWRGKIVGGFGVRAPRASA